MNDRAGLKVPGLESLAERCEIEQRYLEHDTLSFPPHAALRSEQAWIVCGVHKDEALISIAPEDELLDSIMTFLPLTSLAALSAYTNILALLSSLRKRP